MTLPRDDGFSLRTGLCMAGLLAFALLVRVWLVFGGGQLLHMDGPEYIGFSATLRTHLQHGDWTGFFSTPVNAHWGGVAFGAFSLLLASGWLADAKAMALFFSLPAVLNIYLVYRLVWQAGEPRRMALVAGTLYAISFSALYHVRYVHPNDLAISFFLLGALLTLYRPGFVFRILAGSCHFLCFFVYYGYWSLAFLGMLFAALHGSTSVLQFFNRGLLATAGFLLPLAGFFLAGFYFGADYWQHFVGFSGTITMGDFAEGHRVPWLFLWHAEGFLALLWLAGLIWVARAGAPYIVRCCLIGVAVFYALLVIGSNLLELFVVYGRIVKAVVPLLCIMAAYPLARLPGGALLMALALAVPGYLYHAWQAKNAWLANDYRVMRDNYMNSARRDGRRIETVLVCVPAHPLCAASMPDGCIALERSSPTEALRFNWYDSIYAWQRKVMRGHAVNVVVLSCPDEAQKD